MFMQLSSFWVSNVKVRTEAQRAALGRLLALAVDGKLPQAIIDPAASLELSTPQDVAIPSMPAPEPARPTLDDLLGLAASGLARRRC